MQRMLKQLVKNHNVQTLLEQQMVSGSVLMLSYLKKRTGPII